MIYVKDKRIIAHKNEKIKKIAYGLRGFLVKATMKEWSRLGREKRKRSTSQLERIEIEDERSVLMRALDDSICRCSGCFHIKKDMFYNAPLEGWYCTTCAQEYRDFYHKNKAILDQGGFIGDFNEDFHKTFL